jgi:hypothetical protein
MKKISQKEVLKKYRGETERERERLKFSPPPLSFSVAFNDF